MVDGRQTLEASDQEKVERVFRVELAKAIHFLETLMFILFLTKKPICTGLEVEYWNI